MVEIVFYDGGRQIIPRTGYLTGNGNIQSYSLNERVSYGRISMVGINKDPDFSHSIDAWINIKPDFIGGWFGF